MADDLTIQLVNDGVDDWVPLIRVDNRVRDAAGEVGRVLDDAEVRRESLRLIRELLEGGLMEPGAMTKDSPFRVWDIPIDDAMRRIEETWTVDGDHDWCFAIWLSNTAAGDELAARCPIDESNLPDI